MSVIVGKPRISTRHGSLGELVHDRLGAAEVRRRAHHMLPGFFPLVLWVIPHPHPWIVALAVGAGVVAGAVVTFNRFHCIQRAEEGQSDCIIAVTSYAASILVTLILFAPRVEVAFLVLGVFAFGDGSATLGGMLFGQKRLPWNPKKTIVGTACFLLIGAPMAGLPLRHGDAKPLGLRLSEPGLADASRRLWRGTRHRRGDDYRGGDRRIAPLAHQRQPPRGRDGRDCRQRDAGVTRRLELVPHESAPGDRK